MRARTRPHHQVISQCGKMAVMDRLLVKLLYTGHRVLLFSTMTRFLDLMEVRYSTVQCSTALWWPMRSSTMKG